MHMNVRSVDVGSVWDCMLCTCVSEEGGDGEGEPKEGEKDLYMSVGAKTTLET